MKQSIKLLLGGVFLLSLPMFLTSCEDILGEWDKPAPVNVIVTPDDNGGGSTSSNQYLIYSYSGGTTSSTPENIPDGATTDATLTNTWSGTIVITADKTLTGDVTLASDVNLIIKDGVELKVNGQILGGATPSDYSLKVYGQTESTGKLTIDADGGGYNICVKSLDIHGCVISATNSDQAIEAAVNEDIKIYHGDITAIGKITGLMGGWPGNIDIYGGKLTAKATTNGMGISGVTFTLYDGTVIATGSDAASGMDGNAGIMVTTLTVENGSLTATAGNAIDGDNSGGCGISADVIINGGTIEAIGGDGSGAGKGGLGIGGLYSPMNITINNCTKITSTGGAGGGQCFAGTVTVASTLKYSVDDGANYTDWAGGDFTPTELSNLSMIIIPQ